MDFKKCTHCNQELSLENFGKKGKYYMSLCRKCEVARVKEYTIKNKEKVREARKKFREENKELIKERKAKYFKKNIDKIREKRNTIEGKEKKRIDDKNYQEKNRERFKEYRKEYRQQNPEKVKASRQLNYAIKIGKIIKSEYCQSCGKKIKTIAHHWSYLPEHWLDVIWLCKQCHGYLHSNSLNIIPNKKE